MSASRGAPPRRGEVWWLNFNPTLGHEQRAHRPALVLSVDKWNALQTGLLVVLPITSTRRKNLPRVDVDPPEDGLQKPSAIICEQVLTVSVERLGTRLGEVSSKTLAMVEVIVRQLLGTKGASWWTLARRRTFYSDVGIESPMRCQKRPTAFAATLSSPSRLSRMGLRCSPSAFFESRSLVSTTPKAQSFQQCEQRSRMTWARVAARFQ